MKLLVVTQKVDMNDSNLGFFHVWLEKLSEQVDHVYVICLQKGEYTLDPKKVTVLSLGKEIGKSRFKYLLNFYTYIWQYRNEYDSVFVHMNPRYVTLGRIPFFWLWWKKKVLLWYTHKEVNLELRLGVLFASKIFTASKQSFRLKSKKVEVVGHGIPVDLFAKQQCKPGDGFSGYPPGTIFAMTAGRISPAKDLKTFFAATAELIKNPTLSVSFDVYGNPITKNDIEYKREVESFATTKLGLNLNIKDIRKSYSEMPKLYQMHHIFVHMSQTGSMDKVVLEALAAGRIVVTSSEAYADLANHELKGVVFRFPPGDYQELAKTIEKIYKNGILIPNQKAIDYVQKNHSLDRLIGRIMFYFTGKN